MNIEKNHEFSDSEDPIHFPEQIKIDENFELDDEHQEEEIIIDQIRGDNENFKWNEETNIDLEDEADVKDILSGYEQENGIQRSNNKTHQLGSMFYCYLCSKM